MKYYTALHKKETNEALIRGLKGKTWLWTNPREAYYDMADFIDYDGSILEIDLPQDKVRSEVLHGQDREPVALFTRSKVPTDNIKLVGRVADFAENHEDTLDKLVGKPIKFRPEHQEENVN